MLPSSSSVSRSAIGPGRLGAGRRLPHAVVDVRAGGRRRVGLGQAGEQCCETRVAAGLDDARQIGVGERAQPQPVGLQHRRLGPGVRGTGRRRSGSSRSTRRAPGRARSSMPGVVPCSVKPVAWATRSDASLPTWERQWTISTPPSVSAQSTARRTARAMMPRPRAHGCSAKPMSAMGFWRTSTLPAKRPSASIAQPRCVPSSQPRGMIAERELLAHLARVRGRDRGPADHLRVVAISYMPSMSAGLCARIVTTPSLSTGTLSGHTSHRTPSCDGESCGTGRPGRPRAS